MSRNGRLRFFAKVLPEHKGVHRVPGDPKKMIPLIVLICQFKRKSSIKDLFNGIVAKHLEVICAKDGRYIFINKKVMTISVKHDFQDNIYKFQ